VFVYCQEHLAQFVCYICSGNTERGKNSENCEFGLEIEVGSRVNIKIDMRFKVLKEF